MFLLVMALLASTTVRVSAQTLPPQGTFVNLSGTHSVGQGGSSAGGFVSTGPKLVLIRAVGPGLAAFGVAGTNPDPLIEVFDGTGKSVLRNDDWGAPGGSEFTVAEMMFVSSAVGAFALQSGSFDACVLIFAKAGSTTFTVKGSRNEAGSMLVEQYEVSNDIIVRLNAAKLKSDWYQLWEVPAQRAIAMSKDRAIAAGKEPLLEK